MTETEKVKILTTLYKKKQLSQKDFKMIFGERFIQIINALSNRNYIYLVNPVNIKGIIQYLDSNIYSLTDKGVDFVEEYKNKQKSKIIDYCWKVIPIIVSLIALYRSF